MAKANLFDMLDAAEGGASSYQASRVDMARRSREDAVSAHDVDTVHTEYAPDAHDASSASPISEDVASPVSRRKRRVNITLSEDVHDAMKRAAERYGTNVSELCLNGWLAIKSRYGE